MFRSPSLFVSAGLAVALLLGLKSALAEAPGTGPFDKPVSERIIPATETSNEMRCTYYADLMVRELTDGPTSQDAAIVRNATAPCSAKKVTGEIMVRTADMALVGRKGPVLIFSQMDPHGAVDFVVIHATTGQTLFSDGVMPADEMYETVSLQADGVKLTYTRGVNASCSIAKDPAGCLGELTKEGLLFVVPPNDVPSRKICDAAYKALPAPEESPSILFYKNVVLIGLDGQTEVLSRGPFGCDVVP